ncbi:MAG: hypothetical protein ABII18_06285 [bacterium]|nr:hypothetical protein [bacterium]MBU1918911.1 hypothetical protein [bacterium]
MKRVLLGIFAVSLVVYSIVYLVPKVQAEQQTNAVMSKSCDEAKIREIAGDAIIKIEAKQWTAELRGFNITLDLNKLSFADLTKKMLDAGCFVETTTE